MPKSSSSGRRRAQWSRPRGRFAEHSGEIHLVNREGRDATVSSDFEITNHCHRLKDCQAWYVNEQNLCKKRELIATDATELAGYLRLCFIHSLLIVSFWASRFLASHQSIYSLINLPVDYCFELRYDAINKMIGMLAEEITVNKGRAAYAGKVNLVLVKYL